MENIIFLCEENTLKEEIRLQEKFLNLLSGKEKADFDFLFENEKQNSDPVYFTKKGNIAEINVKGFLRTDKRYWWESGTSYNQILKGINEAESDSSIDELQFIVASGGGEVGIVDEVWRAIRSCTKKTTAIIRGMCASAAYYISCACDSIVSLSASHLVGSIGVIVNGIDATDYYKELGVRFIDIRSENAPKKNLDVNTKQGVLEIKKMVDAVEALFLNRVSIGRKTTVEKIKSDFGQGGVFVSKDMRRDKKNQTQFLDALSIGMIDSVQETEEITILENMGNEEDDMSIEAKKENDTKTEINSDSVVLSSAEYKKFLEFQHKQEMQEKENAAKEEQKKNEHSLAVRNVANILASGSYSEKVKNLGKNVLSGESSYDEFTSAVKEEDQKMEKEKLEQAEKEEAVRSNEGKSKENLHIKDGTIGDEESYIASKSLFVH